jgi:UDP-N-acetylglucosamine 2-epimerase (non-hydrolysing)
MRHLILNVVGARPNFMKVAPVHRALQLRPETQSLILHTGQHYDRAMSDVFFEDLNLPRPDVHLDVGSGSHAVQTAAVMVRFEEYVLKRRPHVVAVYGDVNSTVAAALVCAKVGIPVAHVEAGLRSFDRGMPEEINRVVTDHICDLLLVTEPAGRRNLLLEGISATRIIDTGNVMIDSLVEMMRIDGVDGRPDPLDPPLVLVTLHRPSNVDDADRLSELGRFLKQLSHDHTIIFPVHPRTRQRLEQFDLRGLLGDRVQLVEPLAYRDFVRQLTAASLVVTDSGGVQEESGYLGVPCLTLRPNTERPITIKAGTNVLEPSCDGDLLGAALDLMSRSYPAVGENAVLRAAQWDGDAGSRIAAALAELARATVRAATA